MHTANIHSDIFEASHQLPIVVQFYADWCGPCQTLKPTLKALAEKADGRWRLAMIDVEREPGLAAQYRIKSIPTVVLFHKETPIARFTGSKPAHIVQNWLDNNLPGRTHESTYETIDDALRQGHVADAKRGILDAVLEKYKDAPLLKLLRALEDIGLNNKRARKVIEGLDREGPFGQLIKKVRDLIDMDEDDKDVRTPTSNPYHNKPADVHKTIDVRALNAELLGQLVHRGINEVRHRQGVVDLETHPILEAAARDHNQYMMRHDQLTHHQQSQNKRTVKDRILSFGGHAFRSMGENVQYKGFPVRTYGRHSEVMTNTYVQSAADLVDNWVNSPGHYKNLIHPGFRYVGTAVGWNPENAALFATQVFGA